MSALSSWAAARPAFAPTLELALDKSLRVTEIGETDGFAVDRMQRHEHVHHHFTDAPAQQRSIGLDVRHSISNNDAVAPLHDLKGCADNALVFAVKITPGGQRKMPVQLGEYAELALHVVRARCQWPKWRTAQYVLRVAEIQQISEIGVSAPKLAPPGMCRCSWAVARADRLPSAARRGLHLHAAP